MSLIGWDPLAVIIIPVELTEITSMYVPEHFVWLVAAVSTLPVVLVVKLVIHTLMIPPTATVNAIKRTTAIIGLIPFDDMLTIFRIGFELYINIINLA